MIFTEPGERRLGQLVDQLPQAYQVVLKGGPDLLVQAKKARRFRVCRCFRPANPRIWAMLGIRASGGPSECCRISL